MGGGWWGVCASKKLKCMCEREEVETERKRRNEMAKLVGLGEICMSNPLSSMILCSRPKKVDVLNRQM